MKRTRVCFAFALLLGVAPRSATAQTSAETDARAAYERGARAFDARDFATAAREFARADAIAPTDAAIEAAIEAALAADDAVFGMTLVEGAKDRRLDTRAKNVVERARGKLARRVGRVVLACATNETCSAHVDGGAVARGGAAIIVTPGAHTVALTANDVTTEHRVDVGAGETVVLRATDARTNVTRERTSDGEPRDRIASDGGRRVDEVGRETRVTTFGKVLAWTGAGVTVGLGAATAVSYLDLRSVRKDFERGACGDGTAPPASDCETRADRGRAAELRTGLFAAGTAVLGVATVALVALRPFTTTVAVAPRESGASIVVLGRFQ